MAISKFLSFIVFSSETDMLILMNYILFLKRMDRIHFEVRHEIISIMLKAFTTNI